MASVIDNEKGVLVVVFANVTYYLIVQVNLGISVVVEVRDSTVVAKILGED
jgi:hypothetical protein